MILLIDNYDSFVYNLSRYIEELGYETIVLRNDTVKVHDIVTEIKPSHIILSPGPCTPNQSGVCLNIVEKLKGSIPILGVCLGHQVIGQAFGGTVKKAKRPMHGMDDDIWHNGQGLFNAIPNPFKAARYHSLIVDDIYADNVELSVIAKNKNGEIMALKHRYYPIFGVQFHPESVLTKYGHHLLSNFIRDGLTTKNNETKLYSKAIEHELQHC